jgi:deazaflavin-dependent oxidoreductase (nitroreductase family)
VIFEPSGCGDRSPLYSRPVTSSAAPPLREPDRRRRARHQLFWRIVNPPTRPLAGLAPWWVLLETRGRTTGQPRRTPLARGPVEDNAVWVASVHGRHASWVRNLEAAPEVRIKLSGRWYNGHATVHDYDEAAARRFNLYARSGPRTLGIEPVLVLIEIGR